MNLYYMGIDPGSASGAIALLGSDNSVIFHDIKDNLYDTCSFFRGLSDYRVSFAVLEKVGAMPNQGSVSGFSFGKGFGYLEALLTYSRIPHELVSPVAWQKAIPNKPTKEVANGDKSARARNKVALKKHIFEWARKKFPTAELRSFSKDTNRADALAIAYYARVITTREGDTVPVYDS